MAGRLLRTRNVSLVIPEGCGEGSQGWTANAGQPLEETKKCIRAPAGARGTGAPDSIPWEQHRCSLDLRGVSPHLCRGANSLCHHRIQGCAEYRDPWLPSWRPSRTPPRGELFPLSYLEMFHNSSGGIRMPDFTCKEQALAPALQIYSRLPACSRGSESHPENRMLRLSLWTMRYRKGWSA